MIWPSSELLQMFLDIQLLVSCLVILWSCSSVFPIIFHCQLTIKVWISHGFNHDNIQISIWFHTFRSPEPPGQWLLEGAHGGWHRQGLPTGLGRPVAMLVALKPWETDVDGFSVCFADSEKGCWSLLVHISYCWWVLYPFLASFHWHDTRVVLIASIPLYRKLRHNTNCMSMIWYPVWFSQITLWQTLIAIENHHLSPLKNG